MTAVSRPVFTRGSSQMATVRLSESQVPSLQGPLHSHFGARFLAGISQAPFHWPLDGEARHSRRLCMQEDSLGFIPSKYHPDKLRQGEEKLLTSIQGLKALTAFLSGTGCEIRENVWPAAPSFLAPKGLEGSVEFLLYLHLHPFSET